MENIARLTQKQKEAFAEVFQHYGSNYELLYGPELNEFFEDTVDGLGHIPLSDEFILISKPEIHDQVWNALRLSRAGYDIQSFDNGDPDPAYQQSMKVDKSLLEALVEFIIAFLQAMTKAVKRAHSGVGQRRMGASKTPPIKDGASYEP